MGRQAHKNIHYLLFHNVYKSFIVIWPMYPVASSFSPDVFALNFPWKLDQSLPFFLLVYLHE